MNYEIPISERKFNNKLSEEYYLTKDNTIYKVIVGKLNNTIIINCKRYETTFKNNELSILTKQELNSIDEEYEFIINLFEDNKVSIKEIKKDDYISLKLKINNFNEEKEIELSLKYYNFYENLFITKFNNSAINNLFIKIKNMDKEINSLKNELQNLKRNHINNNINDNLNNFNINNRNNINNNNRNNINNRNLIFNNNMADNSGCKEIKLLKNLVNDSYSNLWRNDVFIAFKSIKNIFMLIYANEKKSIISFDIIKDKKLNEAWNAHQEYITNFRYYLDHNKRDLLLSISSEDNNLKLWNINIDDRFECLLDIKNINKEGHLDSACFLKDNNQTFILTSNHNNNIEKIPESIKVYDFNGNKIKEINNSNEDTRFIDTYYYNILSKNYIITCTNNYSKSYDYKENKVYHKYSKDNNLETINSIVIDDKKEKLELIESTNDGNLKIWDFHSGELLKKINVSNDPLREICLWDNKYLFVGCDDKTIKLIEYNKGIKIKELNGHNDKVVSIKQINIPQFGKCLLSQAAYLDSIKLWVCKK